MNAAKKSAEGNTEKSQQKRKEANTKRTQKKSRNEESDVSWYGQFNPQIWISAVNCLQGNGYSVSVTRRHGLFHSPF